MQFLTHRRFVAISSGHLTVDVCNALVPILLAALSVPLLACLMPSHFIFQDAVLFPLDGNSVFRVECAYPGLRRPAQAWVGAKNPMWAKMKWP
jgi:hypothetical protein